YVDIHLAEDVPLSETDRAAREAGRVIQEVAAPSGRGRVDSSKPDPVLASITSFVGAGAPRFWFSVTPEAPAPGYAQLLVQFTRSEETNKFVGALQTALSSRVAGASIDVRTVETGPPTLIPLSIRVLGEDTRTLRTEAEKLRTTLNSSPFAINV